MTSTFAPPTGPPVTEPTTTRLPDFEPVPAPGSSGGRRRSVALLASVVAVVALGVAAIVALGGGRSGDGGEVAEPYSLIAAAESTIDARTVEFDVSVSASDLATITMSGAVDNESQLASITADLSSLLALGDMPLPLGGGEMTMLLDGSNGVVYLDASALGGLLPEQASWVSVDLGTLAEQGGQALDDLQGQFGVDPTDIASALLDSQSVTEVGIETIDGVETKHYEVSIDLAAALAAVPQAELDQAIDGVDLPDVVTYDVWVTADNQLRRVSFDLDVAGQSIAMQLDMTASNEPLDVQLPDESEVFDLTGLLDF